MSAVGGSGRERSLRRPSAASVEGAFRQSCTRAVIAAAGAGSRGRSTGQSANEVEERLEPLGISERADVPADRVEAAFDRRPESDRSRESSRDGTNTQQCTRNKTWLIDWKQVASNRSRARSGKLFISSKFQNPNLKQVPSSKTLKRTQRQFFGIFAFLELVWNLDFGTWILSSVTRWSGSAPIARPIRGKSSSTLL